MLRYHADFSAYVWKLKQKRSEYAVIAMTDAYM